MLPKGCSIIIFILADWPVALRVVEMKTLYSMYLLKVGNHNTLGTIPLTVIAETLWIPVFQILPDFQMRMTYQIYHLPLPIQLLPS